MKILYFIDHLRPDGTQFVLRQLVQGMATRGHDQTIVCLNDSWDAALVEELREAGAKLRIVGKMALVSGYGLVLLWRWVQRERFDVAVTLLFVSDVIGRSVARAAGVPRIVSSLQTHNTDYPQWKRWMVRHTMRWADTVLINSPSMRAFAIREEGAPADRLQYIPNSVNVAHYRDSLDRTALRAAFGLPPEQCLLGSVGRLIPQKGFDVLLPALARVLRQDVHLLVIGTGEQESYLRAQAADLGLQDRVHFTGYRRDVPRLLGGLDLYVHASRFEGMPIALLEAMAAGCPVVASAVDGNRELIEDGIHGWLVPPEHVDALANAISVALSDPHEAQRRACAGQQRVAAQFSEQAMIDAWESVLQGDALCSL
jgi:glycosyltransferase involved in cell wall biosynthesis